MNAVEFFFALSAVTVMTSVIYLWTRFVYSFDREEDQSSIIDSEGQKTAPSAQDVLDPRIVRPERKTLGASGTAARGRDNIL